MNKSGVKFPILSEIQISIDWLALERQTLCIIHRLLTFFLDLGDKVYILFLPKENINLHSLTPLWQNYKLYSFMVKYGQI